MKNWFGMEPHISDEYIHWNGGFDTKERKDQIVKFRAAWDLLYSTPKLKEAMKIVVDQIVDSEHADYYDG